jgi:hypothetical protein
LDIQSCRTNANYYAVSHSKTSPQILAVLINLSTNRVPDAEKTRKTRTREASTTAHPHEYLCLEA